MKNTVALKLKEKSDQKNQENLAIKLVKICNEIMDLAEDATSCGQYSAKLFNKELADVLLQEGIKKYLTEKGLMVEIGKEIIYSNDDDEDTFYIRIDWRNAKAD